MAKMTVQDVDVTGKRVLVRVDFNVPITEDGKVGDDKAHYRGSPDDSVSARPQGEGYPLLASRTSQGKFDPQFSLAPVGERLSELLPDVRIWMADDVIGDSAKTAVADMKEGEIVLLENVRFHAEEEANDPAFAKELASLADLYVSDAFGTVHRGLFDRQRAGLYGQSAGRSGASVCRNSRRRESCR
jgi:phosphoglycerate kinase